MQVRPEQMEPFREEADALFVEDVIDYLMDEHADEEVRLPERTFELFELPLSTLRRMVRGGLRRARAYGMTWESSLAEFVALMFTVAPNFDDHPLVRQILRDESESPDARPDRLWEQLTDDNWEAARTLYDPEAWDAGGEQRQR